MSEKGLNMIQTLRNALRRYRLTWADTAEREQAKLREQMWFVAKEHEKRIAEERKVVAEMVRRGSEFRWDRDTGACYRLTLTFDPRIIAFHSGHGDKRELEILAEEFAHRVRGEVLTCRFVQAKESEYQRPWARFKG